MKILLSGATGYIGQLMLDKLLAQGHHVICCARSPEHLYVPAKYAEFVEVVQVDFVKMDKSLKLPEGIDVAYYLIHSMSSSTGDFQDMELTAAKNFRSLLEGTGCQQIIYLSGISNEKTLSKHLNSRFQVEQELGNGNIPVTVLRAGIIVGAGSASFELIRDLVEKLPLMIAPRWLHTRCQPIAVSNVLSFLVGVALKPAYYDKTYDIGGEEIFTYKEMLANYAKVRELPRYFFVVPFMTPRLSSYWLYFVTSVSYPLAVNLVDSMKVEVVCRPNSLAEELGITFISYAEAIKSALLSYKRKTVFASWKDALSSSYDGEGLEEFMDVPEFGILQDKTKVEVKEVPDKVLENIWSIGGKRGWYYGNWLWKIRGFLDKLFGGVGLRRGRTHDNTIRAGDSLDFWRVLAADKSAGRLLLFAEMKLPGEAWLEFKLVSEGEEHVLYQTATFRPKGLLGRIYWYLVSPFHIFLFKGMARGIVQYRAKKGN